MDEVKHPRARPSSKSHPAGPFVIQGKDAQLEGVYHWICQAYTWEDAIMLASLLKDKNPRTEYFIEVTFEIK